MRLASITLLLSCALVDGAAAATFLVTNTNDSGAGSLRQAILDSNAAGGSNTIEWSSVFGDMPSLSALPGLTSPVTFSVVDTTSNPNVQGALNLGSTLGVSGQIQLSGTLSGSGGISKSLGSTTLVLAGSNTYTGGTIASGFDSTIAIYRDNNLGAASSVLSLNNNARLAILADAVISRDITLDAGSHDLDTGGHNDVLEGAITGGQINKTGVGTMTVTGIISGATGIGVSQGYLVLTGSNTYSGFTAISAGATLGVYDDRNLGTSFISNQGGVLRMLGSTNITREYDTGILGYVGTFDTNGFDTTFSGQAFSTFTFIKGGSGTLAVTGDNGAFTGGFRVDEGFVVATSTSALGSGSLTLNGGGYAFATASSLANAVVLTSANGTLDDGGLGVAVTGSISGPGSLVKTGTGTLTLSGSNSYGGTTIEQGFLAAASSSSLGTGALTLDGGTFRTLAAISSFGQALVLGPSSGAIDTNGFDSTFAGGMTGSGRFTKTGVGTLTLTGPSSFSGGTTVDAGVLKGDASSLQGAIVNDATVEFAQGFDASYAGSMSGVGTLVKTGTGTLTLSGINSYAGGTTVSGGTLRGDTLSLQRAIINNASVEFFQDFDATYSGSMSGSGAFMKTGAGVLTLNGGNTYSGGTTISGGTLKLGAASGLFDGSDVSIGGQGTFDLNDLVKTLGDVTDSGVVALGTGRLNVNTLTGSGVLSLTIGGPASYGGITANSVTLSNLGLQLRLAAYTPPAGSTFTIVVATAVVGQFASFQQTSAAQSFTLIYGSSEVTVLAYSIPYARSAQNPNQAAVASALDLMRPAASGDLLAAIADLNALDAGSLRGALTQMGPSAYAAVAGMTAPAASAHSTAVSERLTALRSGSPSPYSYARVEGKQWYPGLSLASGPGDVENGLTAPRGSRWGYFGTLLGAAGRLDADAAPGYAFNDAGAGFGADYRLDEQTAAGLTMAYVRSHSDVDDGGGTVDGDSLRWGFYGTRAGELGHVDLYAGSAEDFYESHRSIAALGRTADASPRGRELNAKAAGGLDLRGEKTIWSPTIALMYDHQRIGAFSEHGAGAVDLDVARQSADSLRTSAGLVARRTQGTWKPFLSAAWQHEWHDPERSIDARFAEGAGPGFSVRTPSPGRDAALVGAGVEAALTRSLTAHAGYDGEYRARYTRHALTAALKLRY